MSREAIFQRLESLISHYADQDLSISLETPISSQFIDSVELMDFVLTLEDEFGLDIRDDEADRFITIEDVVHYIEDHAKR